MQTKYFKNMFQNISQGVMYSTGVADSETKNSWVACYICAGENEESLEFKAEKAFAGCKQVILPGNHEKVAKELQSAGVKRVVEMKPGSSLYDEKDFWQFKIHCYGTDEGCFLVMFAGDKGIDWKTMDCLMSVRIFDKAKCGNPQIDMENLVCCARCGLYNDFDVCKGHNQNTGKGYTAGAMLLGNISLKKYSEAIKRDFSEVRDQIRYISITGNMKQADGEMSTWIGESRTELNHYYILPSGCADTGDFITKILSESGRNRVYLTGEKCGVCGSGFFISRKLD